MKLLIDTNVLLDMVLKRNGYYERIELLKKKKIEVSLVELLSYYGFE